MSDDEQTQLEAHAPVEGGAQLSHGPGTAAETGAAALAGAAEAVTDPPATLRARMIADLANFVPAGTNVEAVADVLLYHDFANMHEVMEVELTASDLIELFPFDRFDPDLVVALHVGLAVAAVARSLTTWCGQAGLHSCDAARADGGWSARPARRRGRPQHEGPAQAAHAAEGEEEVVALSKFMCARHACGAAGRRPPCSARSAQLPKPCKQVP